MIIGKDREETIRLTAEGLGLGISLAEAGFIYAIEAGEIPITGDVREGTDADPPDEIGPPAE